MIGFQMPVHVDREIREDLDSGVLQLVSLPLKHGVGGQLELEDRCYDWT